MKLRKKLIKESKLYADLRKAIHEYGGHDDLLDALLLMQDEKSQTGKRALLAWFMHKEKEAGEPLNQFYVRMSEAAGVSVLTPADVRGIWFDVENRPLSIISESKGYQLMRDALHRIDIDTLFWDSFLPYGYNVCLSLAVYVLRKKGFKFYEILEKMPCSKGHISNVMKRYEKYNITLV